MKTSRLMGAICGDVAGSTFQFDPMHEMDFTLFTNTCEFTDDTVMTVAVAVLCSGVLYWLLSAVCVCVSLALTFHILNRRQALPEALERVVARMIKLFKR